MALFVYKGINAKGSEVKSSINAENVIAAKAKIQSLGVMLLSISEQKTQSETKLKSIRFSKRVNVNDLGLMTRQLATLVKAKIPLAQALEALIDQVDNQYLRVILVEVRQKINEGSSLAKGLSLYPKVFDNVFINMVEAGESSGTLDLVLIRLAEFTEAQVKLKQKITSSMMYPMIMGGMGFIIMTVIFVGIIPKIAKLLISLKKELPITTQICISLSKFMQDYWPFIVVAIPISVTLFKKYLKSPTGLEKWHALLLRLPVIGQLVTMINVGRFCSTLATLLGAGVPILAALNIVKNLVSNVHLQKAVANARASVSEGASLAKPLIESGLFPPLVTHMIKLGEKSGEIEPLLKIVAESYQDQVNSKLSGLTSILEPIMMVCMGLVVAFVVFSVVIPLMDMNSI